MSLLQNQHNIFIIAMLLFTVSGRIKVPRTGCPPHPVRGTLFPPGATYGPRVQLGDPMSGDEIIENIVGATNQSKGSVLAVLAELDVQLESGLKARRIVQMPNGTHYEPDLLSELVRRAVFERTHIANL